MHQLTLIVLFNVSLVSNYGQDKESNQRSIDWLHEHASIIADSSEVATTSAELLEIASAENDRSLKATVLHSIASYHESHDRIDSALYYALLSKEDYLTLDEPNRLAQLHLDIEGLYKYKSKYSESMQEVFAALELFESLDDKSGIARCYTDICDLMYYEDNYQSGIDYCNKAIDIQVDLDDAQALALSYRFRADNELLLEHYEVALVSIDKAIDILREDGKKEFDLRGYFNTRGNVLKYMERYDEALAEYQRTYDLTKTHSPSEYELVSPLGNIGHVYTLQQKYAQAIPYSKEAIDIMERTGSTQNLWENYMHLSSAYEATGDVQNALKYSKLYSQGHAAFQRNTIDNLEGELKVKYETEKKNKTIEQQEEIISQDKKIQYLIGGVAGLLTLTLMGLAIFNRVRKRRNEKLRVLNQALDGKNQQNELLLKEIHHRVKNNLAIVQSLISLQSAKMDDSAGKDAMIASKNRVQSMGILHQRLYQGDNLGSIEMKEYFSNLADGILDAYGARERVRIDCAMDALELDIDTAMPVGLIVNELLTNALKYAFPQEREGQVKISLARVSKDSLELKVTDNGVGKKKGVSAKGDGFGTQLIGLLTKQLKGTIHEESGDGTSISMQLKIKNAA